MFNAGSRCLFTFISDWIVYGSLSSTRLDFFIKRQESSNNEIAIYSIDYNCLPNYFPMDLATEILECGKRLQLLTSLEPNKRNRLTIKYNLKASREEKLGYSKTVIECDSLQSLQETVTIYSTVLKKLLTLNKIMISAFEEIEEFYLCKDMSWNESLRISNDSLQPHQSLKSVINEKYECEWTNSEKSVFWKDTPRLVSRFVNNSQHDK